MNESDLVFISYAREDRSWADRLYMDLRKNQINAWLDVRCLAAGTDWHLEIKSAIRRCSYFILIVSKYSINKRGFVQREIKEAIDVLQEFPTGAVFLIPARLDATEPIDHELRRLNWVDLSPNYSDGLARILSSLKTLSRSPLIIADKSNAPTIPVTVIDKGNEVASEVPLILGNRAAINYAPFRSRNEFLAQFIDRLPSENIFADKSLSYYITLDTRHPRTDLGDDLKARYPEYITLVLQNSFRDLVAREDEFSVALAFGGVYRTVTIPYDSIRGIEIPEIGVAINVNDPKR